ncbi:MAG: YdeI/OmpD-associated family protein [Anaerolineae bacterium]|nr:YdeI/OmpD-associated family protein [Anaerolineae bacterium]
MKRPDECLSFATREEWRAWLQTHHATEREAWLVHYKKGATPRAVTYKEAVEEALCFGWIDGLLNRIDDERYALRYSPRRRRSVWSESNKRRVEKLMAEGRMTAAGLEKLALAKDSGEWDAATAREDVSAIPADLAEELERNAARSAFDAWPASRKKQYLFWLNRARKPETRQKRIQAIVEAAATRE